MVYLVFRRGNLPLVFLRWTLPFIGEALSRWTHLRCTDSWMACGLQYEQKCTAKSGNKCDLCAESKREGPSSSHVCTLLVDAESEVVGRLVDHAYEKPEAYVFVRLPNLGDKSAQLFVAGCTTTYNLEGYMLNFLPWWVRGSCRAPPTRGRGFFCSEMVATYLQQSTSPYCDLGLVPSLTTAQQLLDTLLRKHPELRKQQHCMTKDGKMVKIV
jgi:hypothetical protein